MSMFFCLRFCMVYFISLTLFSGRSHFGCVSQCVELLAQSSSPDAIEFCNLQSTYEMEGLLEAHDLIATDTDRTPAASVYVPADGSDNVSNQNIANNNVLNVSQ